MEVDLFRDPVWVTRRARSLRPDAALPVDVWGSTTTAGGVTFREAIPPGPGRAIAVAEIRKHLTAEVENLRPAVEALRDVVASHEPVELISSIAIPASLGFRGRGSPMDDAVDTVTWPAKVEYLVGVALSLPPGTASASASDDASERVIDLIGDVFDAFRAKHVLDSLNLPPTGNPGLDEAVVMLRLEHLLDRMPGYAIHLERIDTEVFDRHRDFYLQTLGFNPADVSRVVRRYLAAQGVRGNAALHRAQRSFNREPEQAAQAMVEMLQALSASRTWDPDDVAAITEVHSSEIREMLSFFGTSFGSQPSFRLPTDENLARTHPCIDLGTGAYFIPDPWSLLGAVHGRLAKASAADPAGPLERYRRHREDGHQRLVTGVLRAVFGHERVAETQHYRSKADGPGEIDALVRLEWPFIFEAKAHGLTEPGRRGAPARVQTVARNVIEKALDQTRRANSYIIDEGGRAFSGAEGGHLVELLPDQLSGVTNIIVTFERMDPLAMQGAAVVHQVKRPVWIVNIADLLMVADILTDPASFHHYARTRALTSASGPLVYMESDGLGAYLVDRLSAPLAKAAENPDAMVVLEYMSGDINQYFTAKELGTEADRPHTGVPVSVLDALRSTVGSNNGLWTSVVDEVMTAPLGTWKRWRSFSRRHRTAGTFHLSHSVALSLGPTATLTRSDGGIAELCVPSQNPKRSSARSV